MTCGACSGSVERALQGGAGVTRAAVNHVTGLAEVTFDTTVTGKRRRCALSVCPSLSNLLE